MLNDIHAMKLENLEAFLHGDLVVACNKHKIAVNYWKSDASVALEFPRDVHICPSNPELCLDLQ